MTADQVEYAKTVAAKKIVDPLLGKLAKNITKLNRHQHRGLIRLEFSVRHTSVRLHGYLEKQLDTDVICDNCDLEFAVYGVFASCPDCGQLNALKVCLASLETAKKKLVLFQDESLDMDLRDDFLQDALGGAISAFEAYGKALRAHHTSIRSKAKPNLFQDIEMLDTELQAAGISSIEHLIGSSDWEDMKWFFQARHIYNHNAGVVDDRFVAKQPTYRSILGQRLPLDVDRVRKNIEALGLLAKKLDTRIR